MSAEAWGVLVWLISGVAATWVFLGAWSRRQRLALRQIRREEETRARFAIIRNRLMELVADGRIDSRTEVFRTLYTATTLVMRHMPDHAKLSRALAAMLTEDAVNGKKSSPLPADTPQEARDLLVDVGQELDALIMEYNSRARLALYIIRAVSRAQRHHVPAPQSIASEARRRIEEVEENRNIVAARDWMRKLAASEPKHAAHA